MAFKRLIIAVCVFAIFATGGFTAYQVADHGQDAADRESVDVTNETIPQQFGVWQLVDNATYEFEAGFKDNVTVYNASDVELNRSEDYEWNATKGEINFKDTARTNESRKANISYTYFENTQKVKEVSGPIRTITETIGRTGFLAGGIALVVFLVAFGGLIASKLTNSSMPKTNR